MGAELVLDRPTCDGLQARRHCVCHCRPGPWLLPARLSACPLCGMQVVQLGGLVLVGSAAGGNSFKATFSTITGSSLQVELLLWPLPTPCPTPCLNHMAEGRSAASGAFSRPPRRRP